MTRRKPSRPRAIADDGFNVPALYASLDYGDPDEVAQIHVMDG